MKQIFRNYLVLLLTLFVQVAFAQEREVSGTVSDNSGQPLPGVSVIIKGTRNGVQTDFDGKYRIKAQNGETLVFSFVGMKSAEKVVNSNTVNAVLSANTQELENVVVTAVGIKKKSAAITSSYSTLSAKELTTAANPDPIRSLQGKVSGLVINGTSNGVNGGNSIRIRSMLSFTGNTEALVVIDNVISSADVLATIPSEAIQNVTVLKGAQGAALFGSQGKQGVVMVTTKKGSKSEKLTVSLTSTTDFEKINFIPEKQTKYGQGWYGSWDPQENGGWGPEFDGTIRQVGLPLPDGSIVEAPYSSRGSDNLKDFFQTGNILQNTININGGGADGYVNLTLGNLRRNFVLEDDNLNRNNVIFNFGKKINKFRFGGTVTYTNQRTKQANVNAATSRADYTLLTNLLMAATNIPVKEFKDRGVYGWNGYFQSPWWAKDNNRLNETSNFINLGLNSDYEINKNINISYNGAVQLTNRNQISYSNQLIAPSNSDGDFSSPSSFYESAFSQTYYYGDLMANFNYELTDDLGLKFILGQNMQYNNSGRISNGGNNLEIPYLYNINNVLSPANPSTLNNRKFETRSAATFGNLDLNYKDYLFLNATGRYEGNSVAKKGSQFYFYPSVGVSFVPTTAFSSLADNNVLSNIKVYANYAKIGSLDPVSPYEILPLATVATNFPYPTTGNSYNDLTSITNPNIKPETYTTLEGGLNLGFFNDKLTLEVAGFLTRTKDLITNASLSTTTGLAFKKTNAGELEGKGIEIDLGFMPFNTEDFKWNGRISYAANDTKVISAGESDIVTIATTGNSQIQGNISAVKGLSFPYITGTDWLRDSQGRVIVDAQGRPAPDPIYKNLGKVTPDYVLGMTNNFEYKGIGLSFTLDYRTGHYFLSQTKYQLTWTGHLYESGQFDRNVGFLFPNSVIDDPSTATVGDYIPNTNVLTGGSYTSSGAANRTQAYYGQASNLGSHNLIDATAFKVREIALSYNLPNSLISKLGLATFKVSVNARNPFVILASGNRGYADPEATNQVNLSTSTAARNPTGTLTNTSRNGLGFIGDAQYPSTRTFGFSINTTF